MLCRILRRSLLSLEEMGMVFKVARLFLKRSGLTGAISGIFLQYLVDVSWSMVSFSYVIKVFRCFVPFLLQVQVMMSVSWLVLGDVCSSW